MSSLFKLDYTFYNRLILPTFAPPSAVFMIIWPILFLLITISIYRIIKAGLNKEYKMSLLVNYLFNQLFSIVFFGLKSTFLGFVFSLGTFISSMFLYYETKNIDKDASKFLIPYIIWNIFASVLSLTIFILNI